MRFHVLLAMTAVAVLCFAVILSDVMALARAELRRRRQRRNGTWGVVVDGRGRVLGAYLDPFVPEKRGAQVHRGDSPWTTPGPDEWSGWAWEGFGATEAEARFAANRLRRRHLSLLPWLAEADEGWR